MSRLCECCNHEISGNICSYCGYLNVVKLDGTWGDEEIARVNRYRKELLSQLQSFSIQDYTYRWNAEKFMLELKSRSNVKIADGEEAFQKIVWSQKSFGQNPDEKEQNREVVIQYGTNGKDRSFTAKLQTIQCDDYWKIGIQIHEDFTVSVYLGTLEKHTVSGPYLLDLK